ncbi:MAG: phosphate signaling complex protein PhoU [Candidatus Aminicenantes bacterium]|nr:phosphate signaling complex protein PhoU [Candidatus Aminicenantes bacterium]
MKRHFDEELAELKGELLRMGALAEEAIAGALEALKKLDEEAARRIIARDEKIDRLDVAIDDKCLELIARHQPMAVDLRFLAMAMRICAELERIADLAVDVCQRVLELAGRPLLKPLVDIPKLARLAQDMLHDALDAFVRGDVALARAVIRRDDEADQLRDLVQTELVDNYMSRDCTSAKRAVPLLLVSRHFERICDHTTNIAEDVIYMVEAAVVRHQPEV